MDQQIPASQALKAGMAQSENGNEYMDLYVASACTVNTPYAFYTVDTSSRPLQSAMPASGAICRVVVATETLAAAGYARFQTKGIVSAMITPSITPVNGQTLKIATTAVAAGGAATITPDDFAIVVTTGGVSSTASKVYLLGREITPS